jgi:iron complex transport system substrate-binding protein
MNRHLLPVLLAALIGSVSFSASAACPRIVSQSPYLSIALDWLGRGDCIVGVSRYDRKDLPQTGGVIDPDGEAIAALKPDLFVTSTLTPASTLERITPAGTRSLRLGGSRSLAETVAMLAALAEASDAPDGAARTAQFSKELHQRLAAFPSGGQRILLLSACAEQPHSYGHKTMLGDLVQQAGFTLAESAEGIRHVYPGNEIESIPALVAATRPDLVVNFLTGSSGACDARLGALPTTLVMLPGDNFFHPGPRLLDALDELKEAIKP